MIPNRLNSNHRRSPRPIGPRVIIFSTYSKMLYMIYIRPKVHIFIILCILLLSIILFLPKSSFSLDLIDLSVRVLLVFRDRQTSNAFYFFSIRNCFLKCGVRALLVHQNIYIILWKGMRILFQVLKK